MTGNDSQVRISGAILDKQVGTALKNQLKGIRNLSINIEHIALKQSALTEIKNTLASNQIALNLKFNPSEIKQQAQTLGQNVGSILSSSSQEAISQINMGNYFTISPSTSQQFQDDLEKLVRNASSKKDDTGHVKNTTSSFTQWVSAFTSITKMLQSAKQMVSAVYDIDASMTSLYKVTNETNAAYSTFFSSANGSAKELGRTVSNLIDQTATWAKLGYNLDTSAELAKVSSIYSDIGGGDDATTINNLEAAMKAFNIEASDSITIVDSLSRLGSEFATDSASLGQGLKNSASALVLAGNDIDQVLAMLTGGTEIVQNSLEMSNALNVLSMRLRGMKGELKALGEEYENVESISKIQSQILNQTHGAVNIFDDTGNLKSTYDILKEISDVWDHISQIEQADLLEIIAGDQRGNQVTALIQSFQSGQVEKALNASKNSTGSAYEEQARWMESLEARTKQFEAAFQSLSNTVISSNFLKGLVDTGTGVVTVLDKIFQHMNALVPISAALIGFWQKDRSKERFCPIWV